MKLRTACVVACTALALFASSSVLASTDEGAMKVAKEEQPKAVVAAKEPAAANPGLSSQQTKMKHCNEEARKKEIKGDERRAFMSSCLKG
jgi:hypothetical protein